MDYKVKYKLKGSWFWTTVKGVEGDATMPVEGALPYRVLFLKDHTRIEIPLDGTSFKFSKERFDVIKKNMEKESGHKIP
jgi:hypothetical protein